MVKRMQQQAGGTLLGLIVGLIIGLGIAVVVAIVITKTPMPFVNKMARSDRAAASGDKPIDPNRPLYGRREQARDESRNAGSSAQSANLPAAAVESRPPENTALPPVGDRAPIVDKSIAATPDSAQKAETVALAKTGDGKPSAQNVDDKYTYYLQAGAFREQVDADNTRGKLALMGFEARVTERPSETGTLYRVRIGPFAQMEAMSRTRSELSDNGVDVAVVRMPK